MKITRKGKSAYRILIVTGSAERERRQLQSDIARQKWEREQRELPPPAILLAVHRELRRLATADAANAEAESTLHDGFWLRAAGAT